MSRINRKFVAVLALVLGASVFASQYPAAAAQSAQNDTNLQAEVMNKALNKPDLKIRSSYRPRRRRYLDRHRKAI